MSSLVILGLGLVAFRLAAGLLVRRPAGWRLALLGATGLGLAGSACLLWVGLRALSYGYQRSARALASLGQHVAPRTGEQAYRTLFGVPAAGCVVVRHLQDQVVPRLDCCIWLEFSTCPAELRHVLATRPGYQCLTGAARDSTIYNWPYLPQPAWWKLATLGTRAIVLRKHQPGNPNRDQLLILSPDSTRAYYCDMAD